MLCGQRPFKGEYDQAIIYSILNEEPQNIQEINQNVSDELERIISKLLCKDKEHRYKSSQDLIIKRELKLLICNISCMRKRN